MDPHTLVRAALARRAELLARLHAEGTDCYRLVHGAVEGLPGLTLDRYGPVALLQTWRVPPPELPWAELASEAAGGPLTLVWNHRVKPIDFARWHPVDLPDPLEGHEQGLTIDVHPRRRGQDPLLFLDLRAVRRRVRAEAAGRSVLNLFAYTCGVGLAAAAGGASEVLNVDFAASALAVGRHNAARNALPQRFLKADCLPVMRQLAGMKVGRRGPRFPVVARRPWDLIVLDPPRFSRGPFGAVDVVRDYPSLFKPCVLAASEGGTVVATQHVASVDRDDWVGVLERCAAKAGRPLVDVELVEPEGDFPSPDGRPPLKVAWCRV